ncbi:MAG: exodeoxyribonuclease VII large subunit [Planctomycetes bacterium RBG_19FT_COMBO_48_8]|nr:MAG: exodeoxyribonuclease VII large subunit [Planctomycetes bacterium RBG_19FT_COMBO_48_8]
MPNKTKIYSVGQINSLIRTAIEEKLPSRLIVRGEISDWKHHTSGHCYFSLKDEGAVLPCVMWASKFKNVKFSPEDGLEVLSTGHIDVYAPGGKYQLYVDKLEPAGVGALQLAFEQMVAKLLKDGLFDEAHKKALPLYPMRIGILTSESGAALHDITDSIHSRWPCAKLFLYPVPVQGEGSAEKIAAALRDINRRNQKLELDVLIVGRGGGAMEDLWAFNEEVLARAIYDSTIPVISAVGHEVDTTIADLVADARASTPTKAGVVAVPDIQDILGQLNSTEQRLANQTRARLKIAEHMLEVILANTVFRNPLVLVQNSRQQLDDLSADLEEFIKALLTKAHRELSAAYEQIIRIEPHRLLGYKTIELNNWQNRADAGIRAAVNNCRMQLTAKENRLSALNPRSVLQRGYSITTNKQTGLMVRTSKDVSIGDFLITELANENLIESEVKNKYKGTIKREN